MVCRIESLSSLSFDTLRLVLSLRTRGDEGNRALRLGRFFPARPATPATDREHESRESVLFSLAYLIVLSPDSRTNFTTFVSSQLSGVYGTVSFLGVVGACEELHWSIHVVAVRLSTTSLRRRGAEGVHELLHCHM